jgi:hypothetical protein
VCTVFEDKALADQAVEAVEKQIHFGGKEDDGNRRESVAHVEA